MSYIGAALKSIRETEKKDTTLSGIQNARMRLEAVGEDPGQPGQSPFMTILNALGAPSRWMGTKLGEFTGYGGGDVKEAVQNLLEGSGIVPEGPMFSVEIPWFGGGSFTFAPSLGGTIGLAADMLNPLDPLNRIKFGMGTPGVVDDASKVVAGLGDDATKALKLSITNPFNKAKPLAMMEPGALFGAARPQVSEQLVKAGQAVTDSALGKAMQRRFGTGIATSALPKEFREVSAGFEGLRQMAKTSEKMRGAEHPLTKFLNKLDVFYSDAFEGGKVMSARQAAQHLSQQSQVLLQASNKVQDEFAGELNLLFGNLDEFSGREVMQLMADSTGELWKGADPELVRIADQTTGLFDRNFGMINQRSAEIDKTLANNIATKAPWLDNYVPRQMLRPFTDADRAALGVDAAFSVDDLNKVSADQFHEMLKRTHSALGERKLFLNYSDPADINDMLVAVGRPKLYQDDIFKVATRHVREQASVLNQLDIMNGFVKQYGLDLDQAGEYLRKNPGLRATHGVYAVVPRKKGMFELVRQADSEQLLDRALQEGTDSFGPGQARAAAISRSAPPDIPMAQKSAKTPETILSGTNWSDLQKGRLVEWTEMGDTMTGEVVGTVTRTRGAGKAARAGAVKQPWQMTQEEMLHAAYDENMWGKHLRAAKASKWPVVRDYSDLPTPREGTTRVYHGTLSDNIKSVKKKGVLPGSVIGQGEQHGAVLATTMPQSASAGTRYHDVVIVADVPTNSIPDWQQGQRIVELQSIPQDQVVGLFVDKIDFSKPAEVGLSASEIGDFVAAKKGAHRLAVLKAQSEGMAVPPEVLAEVSGGLPGAVKPGGQQRFVRVQMGGAEGQVKNIPFEQVKSIIVPGETLEHFVRTTSPEVLAGVPEAALRGNQMVLPDEFAKYINLFNRATREPEWAADGIGKMYRAYVQAFKTYTTIPIPGYWLRNKLGDMQLMFLADMNPAALIDGAQMMKNPDTYRIVVNGQEITGRQLMEYGELAGMPNGLTSSVSDTAVNVMEGGRSGSKAVFNPKYIYPGKLEAWGRRWVDAHSRYSMLLDRIKKGDSFLDAAAFVKKHLYSYADLTSFEKEVMRNVMPFYSWMRKNIPHQVEMFLKQPGKFTTLQKLRKGMSDVEVADTDVPSFVRDSMGIPIRSASQESGFSFLMPRLPDEDLSRLNLGEVLGGLSAPFRLPFELATNQNLATGVPIRDRGETFLTSVLPYIVQQSSPRALTTGVDALQSLAGVDFPWMTAERAGRRMSTVMSPFSFYAGDQGTRGGRYEELERLLDLIKRRDLQGQKVPTLRELGLL